MLPPRNRRTAAYTLASLMDRMDSVPPVTSSLQLLPHTPMTHLQQHSAGMHSGALACKGPHYHNRKKSSPMPNTMNVP